MIYATAWPIKQAKAAAARATFYTAENHHRGHSMQIMIIEDDAWIADLLKQIILKIRPHAQVRCFDRVATARVAWLAAPCELIISDWNLPGESGITLLEEVRKQGSSVPIIVVTARADRDSVLQIRHLRINAFISKPFKVPTLIEHLERLLPPDGDVPLPAMDSALDFASHLQSIAANELDLPLLDASQKLLEQYLQGEQPDLRQLIAQFQQDGALCARLIAVANSALYNASGSPCSSLFEALQLLGVSTSLNLALALCLKRACMLRSGRLRLHAEVHLEKSEQLCERVRQLALQLKLQPWVYQSAALLHRMGELCVLQQAQSWEDLGHDLSDNQVIAALDRFSRDFANILKVNWRLPMALREMIGAVYGLPPGNVKRERIVMRLAAMELSAEPAAQEINRLRRLLGLAETPVSASVAVTAAPESAQPAALAEPAQ
jgi:HD-like signal output (HDOD) protein/ActR/RegA family two-component response regulator